MERVVSDLKYTRTDRKSVGHAASHLLHPTQSSTLGETAIPPALFPVAEAISSTSVGQARTHCVHPIHESYIFTTCSPALCLATSPHISTHPDRETRVGSNAQLVSRPYRYHELGE